MKNLELYTKEDAREDMDKGVLAAQASIRKWEAIAEAVRCIANQAGGECGLCFKYRSSNYEEGDCPLYVGGRLHYCGPIYSQIMNRLEDLGAHIVGFLGELRNVAKEEVLKKFVPKEPEFKPITLTIDSEKMANHIWHRLNCPPTKSPDSYQRTEGSRYGMEEPSASTVQQTWDLFDKVHRPRGAGAKDD